MELSSMCHTECLMSQQSIKNCITPDFKKENFCSEGETQFQVARIF